MVEVLNQLQGMRDPEMLWTGVLCLVVYRKMVAVLTEEWGQPRIYWEHQ